MLKVCQLTMAPGVLVTVRVLPCKSNLACPLTTCAPCGLAAAVAAPKAVSHASRRCKRRTRRGDITTHGVRWRRERCAIFFISIPHQKNQSTWACTLSCPWAVLALARKVRAQSSLTLTSRRHNTRSPTPELAKMWRAASPGKGWLRDTCP